MKLGKRWIYACIHEIDLVHEVFGKDIKLYPVTRNKDPYVQVCFWADMNKFIHWLDKQIKN